MDTINITEVRSDWFVASMLMIGGKRYVGIGKTKVEAIESLKTEFNK
jgi:hypothetical protein